jgi:hypothetical protein
LLSVNPNVEPLFRSFSRHWPNLEAGNSAAIAERGRRTRNPVDKPKYDSPTHRVSAITSGISAGFIRIGGSKGTELWTRESEWHEVARGSQADYIRPRDEAGDQCAQHHVTGK